ncbi:hypothetical protein [Nocardiopsis sp. NPDC006938]|uniref:hypothetical protein n=1 Tax=Nocardiopsis sp. NPDC006938 TaxID=3364337 RepID=UPI0036A88FD9
MTVTDRVLDLPDAAVYRATRETTEQWMDARETLIATRDAAEDALLDRWGIDPGAYLEHHPEGWAIYTGERPPGCLPVRVDDDPAWTPDQDTEEGQELAAQLDALPAAVSTGDAETILGLPGRMPLTHTRPDGAPVRRQGLLLDGRMYVAWEHPIDVDVDVWERVDPTWWRTQRQNMVLDQLVARLQGAVRTHVHGRHADPLLDELLTLVWDVAHHSRDHDLLTQTQEAMDRAQEPIRELIISHRNAGRSITSRTIPDASAVSRRLLEQILTQVRALHAELLTGV